MYFVYIIQSKLEDRYYFGITEKTAQERLQEHNSGKSPYTSKFKPWKLIWYAGFNSKEKAEAFKKYLKTGSGYAFSRKKINLINSQCAFIDTDNENHNSMSQNLRRTVKSRLTKFA